MFIIIFILLPDIHEFLVWCLNVLVGFFSLFFLHLGLLALASCLIINWFYIPCFGVSYEISVFPPLFSFLKKSFEISFNSLFYLSLLIDAWNEVHGVHSVSIMSTLFAVSLCPWCLVVDCIGFPISTWKVWIRVVFPGGYMQAPYEASWVHSISGCLCCWDPLVSG